MIVIWDSPIRLAALQFIPARDRVLAPAAVQLARPRTHSPDAVWHLVLRVGPASVELAMGARR